MHMMQVISFCCFLYRCLRRLIIVICLPFCKTAK
uniref:Uncharacterized protein n=1 Tax=Anguilla anguilla TaxID=7936 RepID=A0A0E9VX91_ANGAN